MGKETKQQRGKCGDCLYWGPDIIDGVPSQSKDSPETRKVIRFGKCDATYVDDNGEQNWYAGTTTEESLCDFQDNNGNFLFRPKKG